MTYIELPLWVVIIIVVALSIVLLYLMVSDFLARILVKLLKEKYKEEEEK